MNARRQVGLAMLSLGLLPLLWLWPSVFGGRTFVPYDLAEFPPASLTMSPAQLAAARDGANHDVTEVPCWFLPELTLARDELRAGRLPTWDPHARGGAPLHAHGLIGLCYPPNWLALFADDPGGRLGLLAWLNLAIGGLLAFGLLRELGLRVLTAWFGAMLFQLSGPMATNAFFWMRLGSFVWLPGVLWAVLAVVSAERLRTGQLLALAGSVAMTWLAGFPPFAATTMLIGGGFAAWLVVGTARTRGLAGARAVGLRLGLGFALGGMLAMPQVLPSLQFFPQSARPTKPDFADIAAQAFETYGLLGYLLPDAISHPSHQVETPYAQQNVLGLLGTTRRWANGKPAEPNFNYTEYAVFIGQFGLLLALVGALGGRGHRRGFAVAVWATCAGLALFLPGCRWMFHLPLVENVWPLRWLAPAVLATAWLAAIGLERLLASRRALPLGIAVAAGGLAIGLAVATQKPLAWHTENQAWAVERLATKYGVSLEAVVGHVQAGAPPGMDRFAQAFGRLAAEGLQAAWWLGGAAVWFVMLALLRGERARGILALAAGLAAALQLGWHGSTVTRGMLQPAPVDTVVHAFLRERAAVSADTGGFAIVRASREPQQPSQLPPGELMVPGIRDLNFYTHFDGRSIAPLRALLGKKWGDEGAAKGYLTLSLPDVLPTPAQRLAAAAHPETLEAYAYVSPLEHPLLDLLGVRYVLSTQSLEHAGTRVGPDLRGPGGEFYVYERPNALPRAFTVPGLAAWPSNEAVVAALLDPHLAPRQQACVLAEEFPEPSAVATGPAEPREVRFTKDVPTVVELDVGPGAAPWLVLTDTWLPGWTASVDGVEVPLRRCNHSQRLVQLPPGACHVRFVYSCPGLVTGLLLAAIAGLVVFGFALLTRRRPRPGAAS